MQEGNRHGAEDAGTVHSEAGRGGAAREGIARGRRRWPRVLSGVALVTAAALLAGLLLPFSYSRRRMKRYLSLPPDILQNITVTVDPSWEVTEAAVDRAIEEFLLSKRTPVNNGRQETERVMAHGDSAAVYYWSTYTDGTGQILPSPDGSNLSADQPTTVVPGAGELPFEAALLGATPNQTSFSVHRAGVVSAQSTVIVSFAYLYEKDGKTVSGGGYRGVLVDLTRPGRFTAGFTSALTGQTIGRRLEAFAVPADYDGDGQEEVVRYQAITVHATLDGEAEWLQVQTEEDGRTVQWYVAVPYMIDYEVPALTEEFLRDTVGFDPGEAEILTAFRQSVAHELLLAEARVTAIEDAVWAFLQARAEVRRYPEREVRKKKKQLEQELQALYVYYNEINYQNTGYYAAESFTDFLEQYYETELPEGSDAFLETLAREAVLQQMIFYYLVQEHGYTLDKQAHDARTAAVLAQYADMHGLSEAELLDTYGQAYFREAALYAYVMEELLAGVAVVYHSPPPAGQE
ncbi:MAG: hypothetical protein WDA00_06950 [Eubacteriales bacterium]